MFVLQYIFQTYAQLVSNLTADLCWSIWLCSGFALTQGEKTQTKLFLFPASLHLSIAIWTGNKALEH